MILVLAPFGTAGTVAPAAGLEAMRWDLTACLRGSDDGMVEADRPNGEAAVRQLPVELVEVVGGHRPAEPDAG